MPSAKKDRTYIAIDLKSFYASVECVERGLDPLTTNLVVADASRTQKTICLAVSPSMKAHGLGGRPRLFEVVQRMSEVNAERLCAHGLRRFEGKSVSDVELKAHPELMIDYLIATPRMAHYIDFSARIYNVYLKYIAPEDIHVYSIDEVFIDATDYLRSYRLTAHELTVKMIRDVLSTTGITATAGIGTNMYLCKVAMDIVAKHVPADADGVRIAELDEMSYRRQLWDHRPITDFWRVGHGIAERLASWGMDTMGKVARCSIVNEEVIYKLLGVNAELLIDHAWGWEPCTIEMVKRYRPESNSLSNGQVLMSPYTFKKARVVAKEMIDNLSLSLVEKGLVADSVTVTVSYDAESLRNPEVMARYKDALHADYYGRQVPHHAHGTARFEHPTSSSQQMIEAVSEVFDRVVDPMLLVRRLNITVNNVVSESQIAFNMASRQLDLFTDYEALRRRNEKEAATRNRERRMQQALLGIKKKFGKNAILRGLNFEDGATARERNQQIGGHKA